MRALLIDTQSIRANVDTIRAKAGAAKVYAVLKGNAYGLGLLEVAAICAEQGISAFALTEADDAAQLRAAGYEQEILLLRSTAEEDYLRLALEQKLVATVGSLEAARVLNGLAAEMGVRAVAQVKIDTGMGRYGFLPGEWDKLISLYHDYPQLDLVGIYTHFYSAYDNEKITRRQTDTFRQVVERLRAAGIEPGLVHAANSSALFRYDFCTFDAVRIGSALTGRLPDSGIYGLRRAGQMISAIAELRDVPAGVTVGYAGHYTTRRETRLAVIPVGYGDGFCAEKARDSYRPQDTLLYMLSDLKRGLMRKKIYVTINNRPCRIVGQIGLAHCVADVSGVECRVGDRVYLEASPFFMGGIPREYV